MKKFTKILCLTLAALMCVAVFASCGKKDTSYTAKNTTFKIGASGPLTGGAAVYGVAVKNGAQLAVDEINAAGGLFGVQLELLTYDDEHKPDKVATGYASMLENGMQASLGCVTSAPCAEFKALSKEDSVFFLTPSASNDEVPSEFNGYQVCFADGNQGKAAAEYVNGAYAGKTIGVLYCKGDNYSEGIFNQFKENLSENVTHVDASFLEGTTDFSTQVLLLKDCEFVFMPIYYTPAYGFMLEANKTENKIVTYYGCDGLDGLDSEFDLSVVPQEVSMLSHFDSKATEGKAKTFIDAYKAKYNETPIQFAAGAYDAVYAIVEAMKAAGEEKFSVTMSAKEVCDVLTAQFNGSFTYSGATGTNMKWDKAANNGYGFVEKQAVKYVLKSQSQEEVQEEAAAD